MRSRAAALTTVAVFLALGVGRPAFSQEKPVEPAVADKDAANKAKIEELEKRLDAQHAELEALKRGEVVPPASQPAPTDEAVTFDWLYDEGFLVKGKLNGADFELRPSARLQLDYRAFPHAQRNTTHINKQIAEDQFLIRRARVGFKGRFAEMFSFHLDVDPIRAFPIADFWFQYDQLSIAKLRLGHFKAPFSLEDGIRSDLYLNEVERPMVIGGGNQLAPDYRPGVMLFGEVEKGLFAYWVAAQGQSDLSTQQTGDPLCSARVSSTFAGITVGAAGVWTRHGKAAAHTSFPGVTPGQYQWFTPVNIRGWEQRYEIDISGSYGPFFAQGEFAYAMQDRENVTQSGASGTQLITQGAYVDAGVLLWGPKKGFRKPITAPFKDWVLLSLDGEKRVNKRNVGLELVVRVEWMNVDDARGGRNLDGPRNGVLTRPALLPQTGGAQAAAQVASAAKVQGNECKAITLGLNFYPIENVKLMADWVHGRIGDESRAPGAHRRDFDELLFRAQLEF